MEFVEITLANIEVGANVVRKDVYKSFGPKRTIICRIEEATYNIPGENEEPYIELKVHNPNLRGAHYFRSEEYLIEKRKPFPAIDSKNPNRTFVRRKEEH